MDLFGETNDWAIQLASILTQYKGRKHPLDYQNLYQLLIMVILSAQDSDVNINHIAPALFDKFPNLESLALANRDTLFSYISEVKHVENKYNWLLEIAQTLQKNKNIPLTMNGLIALKGVGRKSANVIRREFKLTAEGIITDLHVMRVAPRIGLIPVTQDGNKAEKMLMQIIPKDLWGEIGMAISFLGREICRPNPKCLKCPITTTCVYYKTNR